MIVKSTLTHLWYWTCTREYFPLHSWSQHIKGLLGISSLSWHIQYVFSHCVFFLSFRYPFESPCIFILKSEWCRARGKEQRALSSARSLFRSLQWAGPGWSQESGASSEFPTRVDGPSALLLSWAIIRELGWDALSSRPQYQLLYWISSFHKMIWSSCIHCCTLCESPLVQRKSQFITDSMHLQKPCYV